MKAVIASIKPRHTASIKSGKKELEIRKTVPKIPTPFKVFVYETKDSGKGTGAVVCEFVCDFFFSINTEWMIHDELPGMPMETWLEWNDAPDEYESKADIEKASCLTWKEIKSYMGASPQIFCWHISEMKVYEQPKPLSWFVTEGDCDCMNCKNCGWFDKGNGYNVEDDCNLGYENINREKPLKPVFRAPQSWCYVELMEEHR